MLNSSLNKSWKVAKLISVAKRVETKNLKFTGVSCVKCFVLKPYWRSNEDSQPCSSTKYLP